jgi:predicted dehydrogenase
LKRVVGTKSEDLELGPPVATVLRVVEEFVEAIRGGKAMPVPLVEGLRALSAVDACYASALSGGVVNVEPLRDGAGVRYPT